MLFFSEYLVVLIDVEMCFFFGFKVKVDHFFYQVEQKGNFSKCYRGLVIKSALRCVIVKE